MSRELMASVVDFSQLLDSFVGYFQRTYGEIVTQELATKVYTSKKVNKFINETRIRLLRPGVDDYLAVIFSSSHFTLVKAEKKSFAAIMLLHKWNIDVGKPNALSDNNYLNIVMIRILEKCDNNKLHLKSQHNFFDRFFNEIDNAWASFLSDTSFLEEETKETVPEQLEKPTVDANDNIDNYRHFANKSLLDIEDQLTLLDIRARNSSMETGFDRIIIETSKENIMFPFVNGFDQSLMDVDNIAYCVFKIILVNDEYSHYQEEYICFGHPNDFLNI